MKGSYLLPLLLPLTINASPTAKRARWGQAGSGAGGAVLAILEMVKKHTDKNTDAWHQHTLSDMCSVRFSTNAGGDCKMAVTCEDVTKSYDDYKVCEVGKQQYWHDDRIGDFSIEYSKAGGINGEKKDGLHAPILRVKNIQNWEPIKVDDVAWYLEDSNYDHAKNGPRLCYYKLKETSQKLDWGCGIPRMGKGGYNLENDFPDGEKGYATGQCGIHIVQHQKPKPTDPYSLEVNLKDANQDDLGTVSKQVLTDNKLSVPGKLPMTVEFRTGAVDADPIEIAYGGDSWNTNDKRCSQGAYDSGSRQIDCQFACS